MSTTSQVNYTILFFLGKETFGHTSFWMNEIKDLKREDSIIALVGNKSDLDDRRYTTYSYKGQYKKKREETLLR